jgi:DNA-binding CsgD family transcriptional regulator
LGYDPDDLAGMMLTKLIYPDDFPGVFAALAATHTSRLGALARVRLRQADGTWRACRMRIAPLSQAPGFGFILRPLNDADPNEGPTADVDEVLHRLSEYLLTEQSQLPPTQLPTSSELPALGQLSSTEWEILIRLNTGASRDDISYALRRDPRTVSLLLSSIFEKLGVSNTEELLLLLATANGVPVA